MRIAILMGLTGLAACARQPTAANTADVSTVAAQRAVANIDNYAAANAAATDRPAASATP